MIKVLLMCTEDAASVNIRDRLLEASVFEEVGEFRDRPVRFNGEYLLFEKEGLHLYLDNIDREIRDCIDSGKLSISCTASDSDHPLDLLVFLSKHRSEKEVNSLTVHPPGNYLGADHGGRDGYLCPSAPHEMSDALRKLYKQKRSMGIKDQTTLEVTHHGPVVSSPCFFIEIGSGPGRWEIPLLGEAIARSLVSPRSGDREKEMPVAVGIGGGHYAPRFTDRTKRKKFDFGHMIPDYILSGGGDLSDHLRLARDATPGAEHLFVHRSKRNSHLLEGVEDAAEEHGLEIHS